MDAVVAPRVSFLLTIPILFTSAGVSGDKSGETQRKQVE